MDQFPKPHVCNCCELKSYENTSAQIPIYYFGFKSKVIGSGRKAFYERRPKSRIDINYRQVYFSFYKKK